VTPVQVHNFSYGILNPGLAYVMSCLGAFLGLRCITRARAHTGGAKAAWLIVASVAVGATGIWVMHFIAMLGFTVPGQQIRYSVWETMVSMLLAVLVVGVGLFIVGYSDGGAGPILAGGMIIGIGVATMHYVGMNAMSMPDAVHYNTGLVGVSVLIAIVAGTAALWAGLRVRGLGSTIAASLIMGVAVTGMHYTGMAAMRVYPGGGMAAGESAESFLLPLLLSVSIVTFLVTLVIALSPTEDEIREDASLRDRLRANSLPAHAPGVHDDVVRIGPGYIVELAAAGDQPEPGQVAGSEHGSGRKPGLPQFLDPAHRVHHLVPVSEVEVDPLAGP
jgi:NO-binding membrane sensor protein with MHYT domain